MYLLTTVEDIQLQLERINLKVNQVHVIRQHSTRSSWPKYLEKKAISYLVMRAVVISLSILLEVLEDLDKHTHALTLNGPVREYLI